MYKPISSVHPLRVPLYIYGECILPLTVHNQVGSHMEWNLSTINCLQLNKLKDFFFHRLFRIWEHKDMIDLFSFWNFLFIFYPDLAMTFV